MQKDLLITLVKLVPDSVEKWRRGSVCKFADIFLGKSIVRYYSLESGSTNTESPLSKQVKSLLYVYYFIRI